MALLSLTSELNVSALNGAHAPGSVLKHTSDQRQAGRSLVVPSRGANIVDSELLRGAQWLCS